MELSKEKTQKLADTVQIVKHLLVSIDVEYAKKLAVAIRQDVNKQRTLAVLNPSHDESKMELMLVQAKALEGLVSFVQDLRTAGELKLKAEETAKVREELKQFFM